MLYDYWLNNKAEDYKHMTEQEFSEKAVLYFNHGGNFSFEKIENYFDIKFNITKLFNKNKELIKEY